MTPSVWYRSFYWRIALTFLVLVVAVIVGQSVMFGVMMRNAASPRAAPHVRAAGIAAEAGALLATESTADLTAWLHERYADDRQRIYLVGRDGTVSGNTPLPLEDGTRRVALAMLGVGDTIGSLQAVRDGGGPVLTAPVQVGGQLVAMVVMPSPPMGPFPREVGRLLSLPGTLVLFAASVITALVTFGPARRRLSALESAAVRLGGGDLSARAPDTGGDEIARLARTFNRMAGDLATRDEALRASDRSRRQMLADISHELRTPLTAIRGYLETLRMPAVVSDGATRERYLETVEHETRRLERIVLDLLDLAKLEGGGGEIDVRLFAVDRVFNAVLRRHERTLAARGISARTTVDDAADQAYGDPNRLEQVIDNLFANAVRHSPDGGVVELRARGTAEGVQLSVADGGQGIPPAHLPHVFDRFYKADAGRSAGDTGSGLGLSIARAIVERHGGAITVASAPGRTEFTVSLPHAPSVDQPASANL